jgi:hypothetical protein
MQILNSPSREEIDKAHAEGSWLIIGVSSVGNVFRVSKFKSWCWVVLLLSSIPIHLLFNSAVFETDFRESDFHLTIATSEFSNGGAYYPPGASLFLPGVIPREEVERGENYPRPLSYGIPVNFSDYDIKDSRTLRNISTTAGAAGQWTRLEASECKKTYVDCSGLKKHRDVVLITNHSGWIRDEMWNFTTNFQMEFWDSHVPAKERNHLFFDTQCTMYATFAKTGEATCLNTCSNAMGLGNAIGLGDLTYDPLQEADWDYNFTTGPILDEINYLHMGQSLIVPNWHPINRSSLRNETLRLSVDYCLAQPLESTCRKF